LPGPHLFLFISLVTVGVLHVLCAFSRTIFSLLVFFFFFFFFGVPLFVFFWPLLGPLGVGSLARGGYWFPSLAVHEGCFCAPSLDLFYGGDCRLLLGIFWLRLSFLFSEHAFLTVRVFAAPCRFATKFGTSYAPPQQNRAPGLFSFSRLPSPFSRLDRDP